MSQLQNQNRLLRCPLCCQKVFETRSELCQHLTDIATALNDLQCNQCSKSFLSVLEFAQHFKTECVNEHGLPLEPKGHQVVNIDSRATSKNINKIKRIDSGENGNERKSPDIIADDTAIPDDSSNSLSMFPVPSKSYLELDKNAKLSNSQQSKPQSTVHLKKSVLPVSAKNSVKQDKNAKLSNSQQSKPQSTVHLKKAILPVSAKNSVEQDKNANLSNSQQSKPQSTVHLKKAVLPVSAKNSVEQEKNANQSNSQQSQPQLVINLKKSVLPVSTKNCSEHEKNADPSNSHQSQPQLVINLKKCILPVSTTNSSEQENNGNSSSSQKTLSGQLFIILKKPILPVLTQNSSEQLENEKSANSSHSQQTQQQLVIDLNKVGLSVGQKRLESKQSECESTKHSQETVSTKNSSDQLKNDGNANSSHSQQTQQQLVIDLNKVGLSVGQKRLESKQSECDESTKLSQVRISTKNSSEQLQNDGNANSSHSQQTQQQLVIDLNKVGLSVGQKRLESKQSECESTKHSQEIVSTKNSSEHSENERNANSSHSQQTQQQFVIDLNKLALAVGQKQLEPKQSECEPTKQSQERVSSQNSSEQEKNTNSSNSQNAQSQLLIILKKPILPVSAQNSSEQLKNEKNANSSHLQQTHQQLVIDLNKLGRAIGQKLLESKKSECESTKHTQETVSTENSSEQLENEKNGNSSHLQQTHQQLVIDLNKVGLSVGQKRLESKESECESAKHSQEMVSTENSSVHVENEKNANSSHSQQNEQQLVNYLNKLGLGVGQKRLESKESECEPTKHSQETVTTENSSEQLENEKNANSSHSQQNEQQLVDYLNKFGLGVGQKRLESKESECESTKHSQETVSTENSSEQLENEKNANSSHSQQNEQQLVNYLNKLGLAVGQKRLESKESECEPTELSQETVSTERSSEQLENEKNANSSHSQQNEQQLVNYLNKLGLAVGQKRMESKQIECEPTKHSQETVTIAESTSEKIKGVFEETSVEPVSKKKKVEFSTEQRIIESLAEQDSSPSCSLPNECDDVEINNVDNMTISDNMVIGHFINDNEIEVSCYESVSMDYESVSMDGNTIDDEISLENEKIQDNTKDKINQELINSKNTIKNEVKLENEEIQDNVEDKVNQKVTSTETTSNASISDSNKSKLKRKEKSKKLSIVNSERKSSMQQWKKIVRLVPLLPETQSKNVQPPEVDINSSSQDNFKCNLNSASEIAPVIAKPADMSQKVHSEIKLPEKLSSPTRNTQIINNSGMIYIMHPRPVITREEDSVKMLYLNQIQERGGVPLNVYQCSVCKRVFNSWEAVNAHICNLVCATCGKIFHSNEEMSFHTGLHKAENLEQELNSLKPDDDVQCAICCLKINPNLAHLHRSAHDMGYVLEQCEVCDYIALCKRRLLTHKTLSHPENSKEPKKLKKRHKIFVVCAYCKEEFAAREITKHKKAMHPEYKKLECKKHYCLYCNRKFNHKGDCVKHERVHTGEKPAVCLVCNKKFRVTQSLRLHMRTHTNERPYKCDICNMTFKSYTSRHDHFQSAHSDERAYKCPYCDKKFKTQSALIGHRNTHTKQYKCQHCDRVFASKDQVDKHIQTVHDSNRTSPTYDCLICKASYGRAWSLEMHLKTHTQLLTNDALKQVAKLGKKAKENSKSVSSTTLRVKTECNKSSRKRKRKERKRL